MPKRMLGTDFGTDLLERNYTDLALTAYPFICRAFCNCGGAEYNPRVIQANAFGTRATPTQEQVEAVLIEYEKAGDLEVWTDEGGVKWCWLTRWFRDNAFKKGSVPACPRPPSLKRLITIKDWETGDPKLLGNIFRKSKKMDGEKDAEEEGEVKVEVEGEEVDIVFNHYKAKIQPKIQDLRKHRLEIARAIREFGVEKCKLAIDNRKNDDFFWKGGNGYAANATRGAAWFFGDLPRVERYFNAKGTRNVDPAMNIED